MMKFEGQTIQNFKLNLTRALHFVWQAGPRWTIGSVSLQVILGLLPILGLYLLKLIVDSVTVALGSGGLSSAFEECVLYIVLAGLVVYLTSALSTGSKVLGEAQGRVVTDYMHRIIHAKAVEIDLGYYENPQYQDKLHRVQKEAPFLPTQILHALLEAGQNSISLIAIAAWLMWYHWAIVPILIIAAIPSILVRLYFSRKYHTWITMSTPLDRQAWYLHELLTNDGTAKEIRLFSLGKRFSERFQSIKKNLREEELTLDRRELFVGVGAEAVSIIAVISLYCFVAYQTTLGILSLGDFVVYFQAVQRSNGFLQSLLMSFNQLYKHNLFVADIYDFLSVTPFVVDPPRPKPIPRPLRRGIVFENVSFRYPGTTNTILEDISFEIRPGQHVALVGENGAGKTSLVKLLCRLYDPTHGKIMLDGVDLRDFSLDDLRREVSVMFQDYVRYHLTARENICLGEDSARVDVRQIDAAVEQAGAQSVLKKLGNGYDTVLGRRFEGGEELSLGEWQKIALARAFLRNSGILVLDEPTSAMDARAEYELFQRFHTLSKGRTAILISHRLTTVRMVDRIYVLENAGIIECGTHDELVLSNGRYAELFETQSQYYTRN